MKVPKRKKRRADLTLTSMIDMFTLLIIYLISTSVMKLASIKTDLPVITDEAQTPPPKTDVQPLGLTVVVGSDGFVISSAQVLKNHGIGTQTTPNSIKIAPKADGKLDYETLTKFLIPLKQSHPTENSIVITADPDVTYESLIATMDATREYSHEENGTKLFKPLFPAPTIGAGIL